MEGESNYFMKVEQLSNIKSESFLCVHIFLMDNKGFNLKLINNICNPENGFKTEEHLFVTVHQPLYEETKQKCHIILENAKTYKERVQLVNRYGDMSKWIFMHSMPPEAAKWIRYVKNRYLPKVIWRTWGHDVIPYEYLSLHCSDNRFKEIVLRVWTPIFNMLRIKNYYIGKKKLKKIHLVGIANVIDEINIREAYGLNQTYRMIYDTDKYEVLINLPKSDRWNDGYYHVMVGHSGASNDRHCEVVDVLKKFEREKIMIHVMLAYGMEEYVCSIKDYISKQWNGKVEFFEHRLDFKQYAEYMNKMDAVIIDAIHSTALGNLTMILFMGKKLFLNRNGVLQKGLRAEGIPVQYTDEIIDMTWEKFVEKKEYSLPAKSSLKILKNEETIQEWKELFNSLRDKNS